MGRRRKVGDEIWTFSKYDPKIMGPFVVEKVLKNGQAHHYHVIDPVDKKRYNHLNDDNAGTKGEAAELCLDYWREVRRKTIKKLNIIQDGISDLTRKEDV